MQQNTSQKSANETDKQESSKPNIEFRKIENTPFTAARQGEKYYLLMGNRRLTNELKSFEECEENAKDASWDRLLQVMIAVSEDVYEQKSLQRTILRQEPPEQTKLGI